MPTFQIDLPVHTPALRDGTLRAALHAWWERAMLAPQPPGSDLNREVLLLGELVLYIDALSEWVSDHDGYLNRLLCKRERYQLVPHEWGDGLCTAYAMEFIHARSAGASITDILTLMRLPSTAQRLISTQRAHQRGARSLAADMDLDTLWHDCGLRMAGESFARHADAMARHESARKVMRGRQPFGAEARPKVLGGVPTTVTILGLLKTWPAHIHLMTRMAASPIPAWHRDAKGKREVLRAMSAGGPVPRASQMAFLNWWSEVRKVIGRAEPGAGGLILCRLVAVEGLNHFIVLDLASDDPGIFDSNFGYMPLNPHARFDSYAGWLLAFLLYYYGSKAIHLLSVPAGAAAGAGSLPHPVAPFASLEARRDAKGAMG